MAVFTLKRDGFGRWIVLGIGVVVAVLPIVWMVLASFGLLPNNTLSPPTWSLPPSLDSYFQIRNEQTFFWIEFLVSLVKAAATSGITTVVAFLATYALARSVTKYQAVLLQCCLVLASIPAISYAIPLREMIRPIKLYDTFVGVVLAETALFAPLSAYILFRYIGQIPAESEEAARLEGASLAQILWHIVLPVIMPGIVATAMVVFVLSWNQFILPLVLTSTRIRVLPVMMRDFFALEREFEWPVGAAVIVLSLLPVSILVIAAHRVFEQFTLVSAE